MFDRRSGGQSMGLRLADSLELLPVCLHPLPIRDVSDHPRDSGVVIPQTSSPRAAEGRPMTQPRSHLQTVRAERYAPGAGGGS
jgi:hypothetical protein